LPVGPHANELAVVRAAPSHPRSNPIAFGDEILHRSPEIRESRTRHRHPLLEPIASGHLIGHWVVIDEIRCHEFVQAIDVAPANRIDDVPIHILQSFVVGSHRSSASTVFR